MVLFRGIDRRCVTSTESSGELEESVQLSHHSMTEGSVSARDGVEDDPESREDVVLLQ